MQPDLSFIIGAARSGTSFVAHSLAQHPSIALSNPKEPHFMAFANSDVAFAGPGDATSINLYSITQPVRYEGAFTVTASTKTRLDASVTSLYYFEQSISNMRTFAGTTPKLCVLLRDPLARAHSSYMYQRARGSEPVESFSEALALEEQRIADGWQHMFRYRAVSDYAQGIRAYREAFGVDALHVAFYEDLSVDPLGTINGILGHLDLNPFDKLPIDHSVNSSGEPKVPLLAAAQRKLRAHPRLRLALRRAVPIQYREMLRRANLKKDLPTTELDGLRADWADLYERIETELGELPVAWR